MRTAAPASMVNVPRSEHGVPIPHVAAWSTEIPNVARAELLCGNRLAIFSRGRQGRGRPAWGVINEERQRRAVLKRRCQICDAPLGWSNLWLPASILTQQLDDGRPVTTEPFCCRPCLDWSLTNCPGLRGTGEILRVTKFDRVLQMVDPSLETWNHADRFDGGDNPDDRARLGVIARRHGGLLGYVKVAVTDAERVAA